MRFENLKLLGVVTVLMLIFGLGKWYFGLMTGSQDTAPLVTAVQIRNFQSDEKYQDQFVLVDVRSKAETDISMIPGALTISEFERTEKQHQGKTVIVYCTVGVRSGRYAASLNRKGWNALNYKGSILDWCEKSLPLMVDGEETSHVHTYSRWFSAPKNYVDVY